MKLKHTVAQIIRGESRGSVVLCLLLSLLSGFYKIGVLLRNFAYDHSLLPRHHLDRMVISVGNIAVGGTGKTPCVQLLAKTLSSHFSLAILTRGFKSAREKSASCFPIPPGASAQEWGDEPLLLATKTRVPVWVGKDRVVSGKRALLHGASCLILDDGLQYRRLHRDIEIVVVDGEDPLAQGHFLPRGSLRDSPSSLKRATLIVVTHIRDEAHYEEVKNILAPFSSAPVVATRYHVLNPLPPDQKVGLFCGLGRPERFVQTVRDLKTQIVDTLLCEDHHVPSGEQLCSFAIRCKEKGAVALLCTEKDAIKLPSELLLVLPLIPIQVELMIVGGEEGWQELLETILKQVKV